MHTNRSILLPFSLLLFANVASPIGAAPDRSHDGAVYRRRPIVYLTTATHSPATATTDAHKTVWHVAWCRPRMGVRFGTQVSPPQMRRPGYAAHWVYETVLRRQIRVAVNGAVFNESVMPSVPIGGVGQGRGRWITGSGATMRKYCVGLTGDGRSPGHGLPPVRTAPMAYAYSRPGTGANAGKTIAFYAVDPAIRRDYPFGFGCVGLLADGGRFRDDPVAGGWENGQSLSPDVPRARTALAWTAGGDFFIIVADSSAMGHGPGPARASDGATWVDTVRFLRSVLPEVLRTDYRRCLGRRALSIAGAVMLDGGVSTEFGYRRVDRRGWVNLDRAAPHGGEGVPSAYVPSIFYAVALDHVPVRLRRLRHRHHLPRFHGHGELGFGDAGR